MEDDREILVIPLRAGVIAFTSTRQVQDGTQHLEERLSREADEGGAVLVLRKRCGLYPSRLWSTIPAELAVLVVPPHEAGWLVIGSTADTRSEKSSRTALWNRAHSLVAQQRVGIIKSEAFEATTPETESIWLDCLPLLGDGVALPTPPSVLEAVQRWPAGIDRSDWTPEAVAIQAGLLMWHGLLEESHQRAQSIEGEGPHRNGDFWHAIMHRREPDYANAKYWFRRVGSHPTFPQLAREAVRIVSRSRAVEVNRWADRLCISGNWNPFAYVDMCETCVASPASELAIAAREIADVERTLLLEQSIADAGC